MNLIISSLNEMGMFNGKISHLLSVVDPGDGPSIPSLGVPPDRRLLIFCDDVESRAEALRRERLMPGSRCVAPTKAMVEKALNFTKALPDQAVLVIHCGAGISRSPAIAFAVLCQAHPELPEDEVFQQVVLKLRPHASPNALIVKHADALLRREGRMCHAIKSA